MSRTIEPVKPLHPPVVGLYACGPTVYDYAHIGHLRKYSMDDVLIRTLQQSGFEVKFVQNVTDVGHLSSDGDTGEDKLEKGAKKYGESVWDIAHRFEDYFFNSMDLMGNLRPSVSCRATDHIQEQLNMVLELEKNGLTYVIEGDGVYFDTAKLDDYGKLARLDVEKLKEGARVEKVAGKKNPTDFALWKFERPGENRAMVWPSPWSERSFPGWHIECSAMSTHYLGDQFDIHTGGIDHIPVHHTNEIAQAESATGKKPFVQIWVHHNFLRVEGEKMSKSLGNFFTIDDVIKRGFEPQALRLLFLTTHYRSELNFTWENLAGAQKAWEKLEKEILRLSGSSVGKFGRTGEAYLRKFQQTMENDLDTPNALAMMWKMLADSNLQNQEKWSLLIEFDKYFGLGVEKIRSQKPEAKKELKISEEVESLLQQRKQARADQDWAKSDQIRDQLEEMGYRLIDAENGDQIIEDHFPQKKTDHE